MRFFWTVMARQPAREIFVLSLPATLGCILSIAVLANIDGRRRDEYAQRFPPSAVSLPRPPRSSSGRSHGEVRLCRGGDVDRGLAPRDADVVSDGLRALATDGTAVLITGHEVRQLLALGDHIIWMTGGTTHYLGPPAQALEHRLFRWDYLTTTL
jgi:hypothetical protein